MSTHSVNMIDANTYVKVIHRASHINHMKIRAIKIVFIANH